MYAELSVFTIHMVVLELLQSRIERWSSIVDHRVLISMKYVTSALKSTWILIPKIDRYYFVLTSWPSIEEPSSIYQSVPRYRPSAKPINWCITLQISHCAALHDIHTHFSISCSSIRSTSSRHSLLSLYTIQLRPMHRSYISLHARDPLSMWFLMCACAYIRLARWNRRAISLVQVLQITGCNDHVVNVEFGRSRYLFK